MPKENSGHRAKTMEPDSESAAPIEIPIPGMGEHARIGNPDSGSPEQPETELWVGRTCWKHYAGRLALWGVGNGIATGSIAWLTSRVEAMTFLHGLLASIALVVITAAIVMGPVVLAIWGQRYRLTSQRLFMERGILSKTLDQTELIRVDDVRLHKSFFDRIFGLGSVTVIATDATHGNIVIPGIRDPDRVAELIRANMRTLRKKSLFMETL